MRSYLNGYRKRWDWQASCSACSRVAHLFCFITLSIGWGILAELATQLLFYIVLSASLKVALLAAASVRLGVPNDPVVYAAPYLDIQSNAK